MRPSSLRSSRRGSKCEGSGAAPLVSAGRPRILGWLSSRRSRARADEGVNYVRYPHAALVMTPRRLAPPPAGRPLGRRVPLLAAALVAGLYAAALPVSLSSPTGRPALALGAVTEAVAGAAEILAVGMVPLITPWRS